MFTTTVGVLLDAQNILRKLSQTPMQAALSFKIARILTEIENHMVTYKKIENEVITRYAEKDSDGKVKTREDGGIIIPAEDIASFQEEISKLRACEVTFNCDKIPTEAFNTINATPIEAIALMKFVE